MGFPAWPYTFISISWFRFGLHHLWYSTFMGLPPFVQRPVVQGDVFARGCLPREIHFHPSPDDRFPAAAYGTSRKRPLYGACQFPLVVPVELEARPARRVLVGVDHGVREPPGVPHDRDRPVLEAAYLREAARLIAGRHQKDVRPGLDLVGQPVVEPEPEGDPVRVTSGEIFHRLLVFSLPRTEHNEADRLIRKPTADLYEQVEPLLVR